MQLQRTAKLLLISRPVAAAQAAFKRRIVPEFALLVADSQELRRQHSLCIHCGYPVRARLPQTWWGCVSEVGSLFVLADPACSCLTLTVGNGLRRRTQASRQHGADKIPTPCHRTLFENSARL